MTVQVLVLLALAAGLAVGTGVVWAAPRLVAGRTPEDTTHAPRLALVPIVGVALARYRPVTSLLTEIGTALIFGAVAAHEGRHLVLVLALAYTGVLIAVAYMDIYYRLVLNWVTGPTLGFAIVASYFWPGVGPLSALLGAAVALVVFGALQVLGRGALGSGDTKLAIVIGAMRGFPGVANALVLGVLIGGCAALVYLTVLRRNRRDKFAYAPYLAAGAVLSLFLGPT